MLIFSRLVLIRRRRGRRKRKKEGRCNERHYICATRRNSKYGAPKFRSLHLLVLFVKGGTQVAHFVEALRYKPEGGGFDYRLSF
jgi:hypothetical protein